MAKMEELEMADALVVEPEAPASSAAAPVEERRKKKAKNKIDPVKEDPYLQKVQQIIAEDAEDDEQVSAAYLKQLIDAHDAKERKEARQKLLKVTWEDDKGAATTKTEEPEDSLFEIFLNPSLKIERHNGPR